MLYYSRYLAAVSVCLRLIFHLKSCLASIAITHDIIERNHYCSSTSAKDHCGAYTLQCNATMSICADCMNNGHPACRGQIFEPSKHLKPFNTFRITRGPSSWSRDGRPSSHETQLSHFVAEKCLASLGDSIILIYCFETSTETSLIASICHCTETARPSCRLQWQSFQGVWAWKPEFWEETSGWQPYPGSRACGRSELQEETSASGSTNPRQYRCSECSCTCWPWRSLSFLPDHPPLYFAFDHRLYDLTFEVLDWIVRSIH